MTFTVAANTKTAPLVIIINRQQVAIMKYKIGVKQKTIESR